MQIDILSIWSDFFSCYWQFQSVLSEPSSQHCLFLQSLYHLFAECSAQLWFCNFSDRSLSPPFIPSVVWYFSFQFLDQDVYWCEAACDFLGSLSSLDDCFKILFPPHEIAKYIFYWLRGDLLIPFPLGKEVGCAAWWMKHNVAQKRTDWQWTAPNFSLL